MAVLQSFKEVANTLEGKKIPYVFKYNEFG